MAFVSFLIRFFSILSFPGDPERPRKRALAELLRTIEKRGPRWYSPWTDRLAADFGENLEALRRAMIRMSAVYQATIDGATETAETAVELIAERALAADKLSLDAFRFETIRAETAASGNTDDTDAMDKLFKKRLGFFEEKAFRTALAGYRTNLKLAALARFRWNELPSRFPKKTAHIPAAPFARSLADLHYLIAGIEADGDARGLFLALAESAAVESYGPQEAAKDYGEIAALLEGAFLPEAFGRVVRAAAGDAEFDLREYEAADDFRRSLIERLSDKYAAEREALTERLAEERLDTLKKSLFADAPLLPIEGFSQEFSDGLKLRSLPAVRGEKPLSVIKSFLAAIYLPRIRPVLVAATVDIDFRDVKLRAALTDENEAMAEIAGLIEEFEHRFSAALLAGAFDGEDPARAKRAVADLNGKADELIQETFARVTAAAQHARLLMEDLKARSPELVSNAGFVNVHKPKVAKGIEEAVGLLDRFYVLLQNIAVDAAGAKLALGSRASD